MGEQEIEVTVASLRRAVDTHASTLGDIPTFDVALAYRLYRALLEPLASTWGQATNLVVVPHKAVASAPGLLGGQCLSLADYVAMTGAGTGPSPAERVRVDYAHFPRETYNSVSSVFPLSAVRPPVSFEAC